jgi:hypothetical protein
MLRRRQINADPKGAVQRFALGAADAARWRVERVAWRVERRLVWPLRERTAGLGPSGHAAGAAALGAVAVVAVLAGVLLSKGTGASETERLAPARVAAVAAPSRQATGGTAGHVLKGVPPSFGVGKGVGVAKQGGAESNSSAAPATNSAGSGTETESSASGAEAGEGAANGEEAEAATASAAKPVPAGPEAMKVARRFSEAFVFYEIGERQGRAKAVFGETASEQLAEALAERPPRLPANAEVPKAKVVNLVPGPRRGSAYTVSVSLLRVGVTSELRLSLQHSKADGWQVTDVLG